MCMPSHFSRCPPLCAHMNGSPPGSPVHGDSPGKNTGVSCHSLLQGTFLTQGLNPLLLCLRHWQMGSSPQAPPWKHCGKDSTGNTGDTGGAALIPGLGRPPRGRNGNPLQHSFLENSTDKEAWRATSPGLTKSLAELKWKLRPPPSWRMVTEGNRQDSCNTARPPQSPPIRRDAGTLQASHQISPIKSSLWKIIRSLGVLIK